MSYKTILVHLEHSNQAKHLLNAAVRMAIKYDAHLIGTYIKHPIETMVGVTSELSVYTELTEVFNREQDERAVQLKAIFEKKIAAQGIVSEWRYVDRTTETVNSMLLEMARSVDLVMISGEMENLPYNVGRQSMGPVVTSCSCPVLLVPETYEDKSLGDFVLIAWDGSRESSRAVFGSLPVLQCATTVWLHRVNSTDESKSHGDDVTKDLADALARHGVDLELSYSKCSSRRVGQQLLSTVESCGADCLVMGAYGHSRIHSLFLGGATDHVLGNTTVPLLLSH